MVAESLDYYFNGTQAIILIRVSRDMCFYFIFIFLNFQIGLHLEQGWGGESMFVGVCGVVEKQILF